MSVKELTDKRRKREKRKTHIRKSIFGAPDRPRMTVYRSNLHLYVQVIDVTTKPFAETRPEIHREYIDVQFMVRGREKIGVAPETGKNTVAEDLLAERDLLFYTGVENESVMIMMPGHFAILMPNDVHRPAWAVEQPEAIRKVVMKVRVSLL